MSPASGTFPGVYSENIFSPQLVDNQGSLPISLPWVLLLK